MCSLSFAAADRRCGDHGFSVAHFLLTEEGQSGVAVHNPHKLHFLQERTNKGKKRDWGKSERGTRGKTSARRSEGSR